MAEELNFQLPERGFDSYLAGIIPDDQAVLAGAFSVAMQQIRDLDKVDAPTFAKVVYNMESTVGLPLVNGTDVPTNQPLAGTAKLKEALGSGIYGTFTMSNFFGAMSGLPYPWKDIFNGVKELQTQKLINIYQELFLAVTWQQAGMRMYQPYNYDTVQPFIPPTVSPNPANPAHSLPETIPNPDYDPSLPPGPGNEPTIPNPDYSPIPYLNGSTGAETTCPSYYSAAGQPGIYNWYYNVTPFEPSPKERGGGYHRGTAPNPRIICAIRNTYNPSDRSFNTTLNLPDPAGGYTSPTGIRCSSNIGKNPEDCASVFRKTYGRFTGFNVNNPSSNYYFYLNDNQTSPTFGIYQWYDVGGQDTCDNPPPKNPVVHPGYPGPGGGGLAPRPMADVKSVLNIPRETIEIQHPPKEMLPVTDAGKATNGVNTIGNVYADQFMFPGIGTGVTIGLQSLGYEFWPVDGNPVVQGYIDQANTEIQAIRTRNGQNFEKSTILNTLWDITGIALKHEQRARYNAVVPVPIPWDRRYAGTPMALNVFVDSIPDYAKQTQPHMAVQTLEHISNVDMTGGQSIVAMMRQERNQDRLAEVGIQLDNNMPSKMDVDVEKRLMLNGTVPGAVEGIRANTLPGTTTGRPSGPGTGGGGGRGGGNGTGGGGGSGNVTIPTNPVEPEILIFTIPSYPTDSKPNSYLDLPNTVVGITDTIEGNIKPILDGDPNPIVNPEVPSGPGTTPEKPKNPFVLPPNINVFPPPPINSDFTGTTLKPSTYDVNDAITKVIECNCDCWVN